MFGLGVKKSERRPAAPSGASPAVKDAPNREGRRAETVPGLMQDRPVNLIAVLQHAAVVHRDQLIVSVLPEGVRHRQTYAETYARTQRLAAALKRLGVEPGDRIGTLAWNTHRHLEAWYAISGQGAICHTINPRLAPEQIAFIVGHAEDRMLMIDAMFAPLVRKIASSLPSLERVIVFTDRAHMPDGGAQSEDWLCFEELLAPEQLAFDWPSFPEETASSLCYTSGTTGEPKGVLYSHRSNLLQSYAICSKDAMNLGLADTTLMIVPMFHANAWGLVYGAPAVGAKLVLPGAALDGPSVHRLIKEEGVTCSSAVPTVWAMLLAHLEKEGGDLAPLREVTIGGAAVPRSMVKTLRDKYAVTVAHGWGMTEMSPVGTINRLAPKHARLDPEAQLDLLVKQGRPLFGVEMKIVDEEGRDLARDGKATGRLLVRGPWIAKAYYRRDDKILDADGWFDTGDVASIDPDGVMQITDRAKDIIKSGGEWISSVDLENCAMGAPGVQLAAAIGVAHPKWGERPLLLVVPKPGASPTPESILAHLGGSCAKWQLPDDIVFVDALPLTAAGKFDKKVLRARYADHLAKTAG
jgi:fatty-acyl-CoA synthase